jgi:hypothetical protein
MTRRPIIGTLLCPTLATQILRSLRHAHSERAEIEPDIRLSRKRAGSVTNVAISGKIALGWIYRENLRVFLIFLATLQSRLFK